MAVSNVSLSNRSERDNEKKKRGVDQYNPGWQAVCLLSRPLIIYVCIRWGLLGYIIDGDLWMDGHTDIGAFCATISRCIYWACLSNIWYQLNDLCDMYM